MQNNRDKIAVLPDNLVYDDKIVEYVKLSCQKTKQDKIGFLNS